jgi:hypothetical protein
MIASCSPVVPNASSRSMALRCDVRSVDNGAITSTCEPIAMIIASS